ncbi:hypothetical protein V8E36_009408 [Tilletia maclaganii]
MLPSRRAPTTTSMARIPNTTNNSSSTDKFSSFNAQYGNGSATVTSVAEYRFQRFQEQTPFRFGSTFAIHRRRSRSSPRGPPSCVLPGQNSIPAKEGQLRSPWGLGLSIIPRHIDRAQNLGCAVYSFVSSKKSGAVPPLLQGLLDTPPRGGVVTAPLLGDVAKPLRHVFDFDSPPPHRSSFFPR